eukprot:m.113956 g.113956  ORF g.113956 m.113956 type:complete len:682 (-) comp28312_c1_seq2:64-2109(-)
MGKNTGVKIKRVGGEVASRRGAGKTNFGRVQKGNHSMNPDRANKPDSSHSNFRTRATVNRLKMYKSGGRAIRAKNGQIITPAPFQNWVASGTVSRVEPNRKWFGNTRVIGQKDLTTFRDAMSNLKADPYSFVLKANKLPMSLLTDPVASAQNNLLSCEPFAETYGKKSRRKRPNLATTSMEELRQQAEAKEEKYDVAKDKDLMEEQGDDIRDATREGIFMKGQSKRIWGELYKVIDSSDIVVQVLDARDPMGTRSKHIEDYLKNEKGYKQLVFVLNKCDLAPNWATARWVAQLSREYPTLAFHASITNAFGKGALIELLRQFGKLHSDKQQISVGFIGYPNVGKSSVINTLRAEKVCKTAPVPGETKCWQYVTLMRKIYLIDCPGVVYNTNDSEADIVLKGVVRVENLKTPEDYIETLLERTKPEYIERTYGIKDASAKDHIGFLEKMATKMGKLWKKAQPDTRTVALMVLHDWQQGKLPYFTHPPAVIVEPTAAEAAEKLKIESQDLSEIKAKNSFFSETDLTEPTAEPKTVAKTTKKTKKNTDTTTDTTATTTATTDAEPNAADGVEELTWDDLAADAKETKTTASKSKKGKAEATTDPVAKKKRKLVGDAKVDAELKKKSTKKKKAKVVVEEEVESEDDSKYRKQKKEPRKASKKQRIGQHYYQDTNTKQRKRRGDTN